MSISASPPPSSSPQFTHLEPRRINCINRQHDSHLNTNASSIVFVKALTPSFVSFNSQFPIRHPLLTLCSLNSGLINDSHTITKNSQQTPFAGDDIEQQPDEARWSFQVRNPNLPPFLSFPTSKISLADKAFFLLAIIAGTTSVAFTSFVIAAIPTLQAMRRAAIALSRLADTTCEELPGTMAAIRLSGMEISDLTLELSDLSQEISDGITKSAQAVQAAEAGIRQIGSLARQQTISMIQERANLPEVSLQPVVSGAARKTSRAVGQATRTFINIISRGELHPEDKENETFNR